MRPKLMQRRDRDSEKSVEEELSEVGRTVCTSLLVGPGPRESQALLAPH